MQIIDLRAEHGCNGQYFGRNGSCACRRIWRRGRADALAPRAIVATAARRRAPPSPICELWRGARGAADRIHSWAAYYSIRRRALNFGAAGGRSCLRSVALPRPRLGGGPHRARFASTGAADEGAIDLWPVCALVLAPSRNATRRHPCGARKRTAAGSAHTARRCAFSARQRLEDRLLIALATMDWRITWSTPNSTSAAKSDRRA